MKESFMNTNNMRDIIIAQFFDPPKVPNFPLFKKFPATKKGKTLADFYTEVFKSSRPLYETKSAKELEIMMMQNRKLIESKTKRR
jgi:hypothetical protein